MLLEQNLQGRMWLLADVALLGVDLIGRLLVGGCGGELAGVDIGGCASERAGVDLNGRLWM